MPRTGLVQVVFEHLLLLSEVGLRLVGEHELLAARVEFGIFHLV